MIAPDDPLRARLLDDQSRCLGVRFTRRGLVTCVRRTTCLRHVSIEADDASRTVAERVRLPSAEYLCDVGNDAFLSLMKD